MWRKSYREGKETRKKRCHIGFMMYRSNDYSAEKVKDGDGYVQVMSVGVYQEELETPEKPTFSAGQSFFDSVGEFFAELIFGEN